MKVLSIDPGYDRCGVAVLEGDATQPQLLFSTCIETDKESSFSERLYSIGSGVSEYIEKWNPEHVAIERLFFSKNKKTALKVAEARGVLLYVTEKLRVPLFEYDPSVIKIAITGHGGATKDDVMRLLPRLVDIEKDIPHDDEYDAIAVGITHLAHYRNTPQ